MDIQEGIIHRIERIKEKRNQIKKHWQTYKPKYMEAKLIWYEKKNGTTSAGDFMDAVFFLKEKYRGSKLITVRVYECYQYSESKMKDLLDKWYLLDFAEHRQNGEVKCYVLNELQTVEKKFKRVPA